MASKGSVAPVLACALARHSKQCHSTVSHRGGTAGLQLHTQKEHMNIDTLPSLRGSSDGNDQALPLIGKDRRRGQQRTFRSLFKDPTVKRRFSGLLLFLPAFQRLLRATRVTVIRALLCQIAVLGFFSELTRDSETVTSLALGKAEKASGNDCGSGCQFWSGEACSSAHVRACP